MNAIFGKVTSKSQTTLPEEVLEALGAKPGDTLVYRVAGGKVTLARAEALDKGYLQAVEETLSEEWNSPEDAAAFDKL